MLEMGSSNNTWEKGMRKFFRWLYNEYDWKMLQWIWGLDKKQVTHIRKRVEETDFKENYGGELVIEISNPML